MLGAWMPWGTWMPGPLPLWTDRHLWKHNLHKLCLRPVIMLIYQNFFLKFSQSYLPKHKLINYHIQTIVKLFTEKWELSALPAGYKCWQLSCRKRISHRRFKCRNKACTYQGRILQKSLLLRCFPFSGVQTINFANFSKQTCMKSRTVCSAALAGLGSTRDACAPFWSIFFSFSCSF